MKRNIRIDLLRGICMFYIVGIFHLSQYIGVEYYLNNNVYGNSIMWSCLGTFSLISGYLIGRKYNCETWKDVLFFYKKRVVRFYPLFFLSAVLLYTIGFNNLGQTINSLLGLAPFLKPRPLTLWYISMIMVFYFISPFVLNAERVKRSMLLFIGFVVLSHFIAIDYRFIFNLFFYLTGLCTSCLYTKFYNKNNISLMAGGGRFLTTICLTVIYAFMFIQLRDYNNFGPYRMLTNTMGVFCVVLFIYIQKSLLKYEKLISFLAYTSMSCYLFHRFVYWVVLSIFEPQETLFLIIYMYVVAVPVCFVFSYYIQKIYDRFVSKMLKS